MALPGAPNYDFTLTMASKTYGYMLFTDPQTGQKHWNEGLAPLLSPQQRTTEFSYEHIPPEIDVPVAFEDWSKGAGLTEYTTGVTIPGTSVTVTGNSPKGYNYSRNIDLSSGIRAYQSPARQADDASTGGAIAAAPTQFWYSATFGLWCMASIYLYKYDLSSGTWVLKDTGSGAYTSVAELNGVMYASISGYAYHYSTDGTTWTTSTLGGSLTNYIVDLFVTRNNGLWAMRSESLYTTTNGQNGGSTWSAATIVGSTSESTKSMVTVNADIWIFKREGIYLFDGTTVTEVYTPTFIDSVNGTYAYVHSDGHIYVVYERSLLSVDPFGTSTSPIHTVYPLHTSEEIKGTISQITGTFVELFFTVTNPDGRTYLMKLNPDPEAEVPHTYAYLGTATNSACLVVSGGVAHATNPCLVTGYSTAAVHYILPRANLRPEDDELYEYETSTGIVYGPWVAFGARAFNKFLNRGTVLTLNATAGQPVLLAYALDNSTTATTLVTAVDPGLSEANTSGTVSFNRLQYQITMNAASVAQSPILVAATLHATMNPPRRRMWKPLIVIAPSLLMRNGVKDNQDSNIIKEALFSGAVERITMVDRNNHSFIVRLLDIQEQQLLPTETGGTLRDHQVFQLAIAEISPLTTELPTGIYGDDVYGGGKVYA